MDLFFQQVLAGISTGCIYAMTALAISIVYLAVGHLNYAQGEMAMLSTFLAWTMLQLGVPFGVALAVSALGSFVIGAAIQRLIFEPIKDEPPISHVVIYIGLFSIFNGLAAFIWGAGVKTFPSPFGSGAFGGLKSISTHQVGMLGVTVGLLGALIIFFRGTRTGLRIRAAADNRAASHAVGISVRNINAFAWGLSAVIGAIAGALIAPVVYLEPNMMLSTALSGFAGALLGGLTNPAGAVLGGFAVAIMENMVGTYVPVVGQELKSVIALLVVITVMVVSKGALFERRLVKRF